MQRRGSHSFFHTTEAFFDIFWAIDLALSGLNGISSASIAVEGTPRAVSGHKCLVLCAASVAAAWVPLPLGTYEESPRRRRRGRRSISIPWGGVWGHEPEEKRAAWTQGEL